MGPYIEAVVGIWIVSAEGRGGGLGYGNDLHPYQVCLLTTTDSKA
jgi:hypothetical protein